MKRIDILYVLIGAVYLIVGMALGIVMGIKQNFQLEPVHAHINLLGFVSHAIFGLVHRAWPSLRASALAGAQFWFFVVGTPVFLVGITIAILAANVVLAIVGSILVLVGGLLFLTLVARAGLAAASTA